MTVMPGDFGMGKSLVLWFIYCLAMGIFAAYICGRALNFAGVFLHVFTSPAMFK
jgi:hypothetical protein